MTTQEAEKWLCHVVFLFLLPPPPSHNCRFFTFLLETSLVLFLHTLFPGSMHLHSPDLSEPSCTLFPHKENFDIHHHRLLGHDICSMPFRDRGVCSWRKEICTYNINQKIKAWVHFILKSVNMCTSAYFGVRLWLDIGTQALRQSSMPAAISAAQSPCLSSRCLGPAG